MNHIVVDARIIRSSTGTYVLNLLRWLEKIDHKNRYTILVPSADIDYYTPEHRNFSLVACDIGNYSLAEQTEFKTFLENLNPDLVHFCMPQQPIRYKGRSVTTVHDLTLLKTYNTDKNWLMYKTKQQVGKHVFKKIAKTNEYIITPSNFTRDEYIAFTGIDPERVKVTYEAAETSIGDIERYDVPHKDYLLYVGQQSDYKNIPRLAASHQKLLEKHPDLGLVLVGGLNKAALKNKRLFASLGYKNIHFTGFVSNPQRDWLYKHARAYVFPSLMEGFGLPGLEVMTYGTPLVSSNATCLPEVYGEAAHYFNPTDTGDMTRAIDDVLTDKKLRRHLIHKAHKQLHKYSWKKTAHETLEIYEKALL